MNTLKNFIKESINDYLDDSSKSLPVSNRDRLTALEIVACKQLFNELTPGTLSYKYNYSSTGHPEGVLVTCSHSGKTYLVSLSNGHIVEFRG